MRSSIAAVLLLSGPMLGACLGDDPAKPAASQIKDQDKGNANNQLAIDALVTQLEHPQLTKREEARRELIKAGKSAIPSLAKAALSGKRALIEKSIDILAKLVQSSDVETKEAAKVTLQMLSESEQPSTAERAKLVLQSKPAEGIQPFEGWDKANNPFGGGGAGRSVQVSNSNGRRSVTVKESGKETTVEELAGGKVHATITGGKEPVELLVKDLDELKKKCPEAFDVFQQYAGKNMVNFGGGNFGNANGFAFGGGGGGGPAPNAALVEQLNELKQRFEGNAAMQQMLDQHIQMLKNTP